MTSSESERNHTTNKHKNKIVYILVGIIVVLTILYHFIQPPQLQEIDIHTLNISNTTLPIAIQHVERNNQEGLVLIRTFDAQEQFLPGTWNIDFVRNGAYTHGTFPEDQKATSTQKIFFITNNVIQETQLLGTTFNISEIQSAPTSEKALIGVYTGKHTQYCVSNDILSDQPFCQPVSINKNAQARWNTDDEIILLTDEHNENEGNIYVFTIDTGKLKVVAQEEKERRKRLARLFAQQPKAHEFESQTFWKLRNTLLVKKNNKKALVALPKNTLHIGWLSDAQHILIVQPDRIAIINPDTNSIAPLIEEKDIGYKKIITRHTWNDLEFN